MEFDVFGRHIIIERQGTGWAVFEPGDDGKRREAPDIVISPDVPESGLLRYLADLCHEGASPVRPDVRRLR